MCDEDTKDCNSCGTYNEVVGSVYCERCGFNLCDDAVCLYDHLRDRHNEALGFLKPGFWEEKE